MVCLDSAALNSRDGPDFAPQLCYTRHSREAGRLIAPLSSTANYSLLTDANVCRVQGRLRGRYELDRRRMGSVGKIFLCS